MSVGSMTMSVSFFTNPRESSITICWILRSMPSSERFLLSLSSTFFAEMPSSSILTQEASFTSPLA